MAEVIWKFPITGSGESNSYSAEMPEGAKPLSAGISGFEFVVWAAVDPRAKIERRFFHIAGTGHDLPRGLKDGGGKLLNRVEISAPSGLLIFHVFDTGAWDTTPPSLKIA